MSSAAPGCSPGDLLCLGQEAVGGAISAGANNAITDAAVSFAESFDTMVRVVLTSWLGITPDLDLLNPDTGAQAWITQSFNVLTIFFVTLGLIVAGARVVLVARGEPLKQVGMQLLTLVLVTTIGNAAVQMAVIAGHAYGEWLLRNTSSEGNLGTAILGSLAASAPGLVLLIAVLGVISVVIQYGIMLLRAALLPLLVAFWPVAAAGSLIPGREGMASKVLGWIVAFVLYVPITAAVYAFAFQLKNTTEQDFDSQITGALNGLVLIVLAVLVLPALMRIIAPAANAVGSKTGGMMALAGGAAVVTAGVAAGAAVATSGASLGATGAGTVGGAAAGSAGAGTASGGAVSAGSAGAGAGASEAATSSGTATPATGAQGTGADGSNGSNGSSGADGNNAASGAEPASGGGGSSTAAAGAAAQSLSESAQSSNTAEGMIDE